MAGVESLQEEEPKVTNLRNKYLRHKFMKQKLIVAHLSTYLHFWNEIIYREVLLPFLNSQQ